MLLTIAIPTYNRAAKLDRLLCLIYNCEEISGVYCQILISNNSSTDNTTYVVDKYQKLFLERSVRLISITQKNNIGMSANFLEVYRNSESEYVWWVSDDDILVLDNFKELIKTLESKKPNVLNFNFIQAPYTEISPRYKFEDEGHYSDPNEINRLLSTKITSIIVRKYSPDCLNVNKVWESYWSFVYVVLEILYKKGGLTIISNIYAKSDDDFLDIRYPPKALYQLKSVFEDSIEWNNVIVEDLGPAKNLDLYLLYTHFYKLYLRGTWSPTIVQRNEILDVIVSRLYRMITWTRYVYLKATLSVVFYVIIRRLKMIGKKLHK